MPELGEAFRPARTSFAELTRARSLPVMLTPVAIGAALAYRERGTFSWAWLAVTLAGAAAAHLAANVAADVADVASGADAAARTDGLSAPTASVAISSGAVSRSRALAVAATLGAIALACGIGIGAARTWTPIALGAGAMALAVLAFAPPIRYATRVPFSAEVAAILASGVLPCAASYAVHVRDLDAVAFTAGLAPGVLLALVFFHQAFLRHGSDRRVGRPSTVSVLGPSRAILVSAVLAAAAFGVVVWQILAGTWPSWAAIAILGELPLMAGYRRIAEEPESVHVQLTFLGAAVGSAALVNGVLIVALVVDGLVG